MASSLLTTDKRWAAPARKSGMTVLGKIPKPINLPSQRLENHGLDPSVEIVPKGTLTWGSKPQPTTANAWSSPSLLSPKNDGGSSSPSYINGRPSSGGGTRPSTAGSERSLDSPSAWGPNSRPSTASGTLASHNLLTAANRPRSAETRPGSSHLSRFADSSTENVKVSIRTMDKSGHTSQAHGFTLSTGDFPTLGSEKNSESNSQRGHSSQGRPTSSSGREAAQNEHDKNLITGAGEVISSSNYQHVKKTEHAYEGGAPFPATNLPREAQQAQQYPPNLCMPPPQFDSWHAPPGHPPEGLWHRGVAPRGPYRPAGPPSSFPVEPFAYYGQFPPSSEAAATQGPGHGVYHPRHGGAYHPHMPHNSYAINQPVIPVRPVYQGPLPYDAYYGPPPGTFNNANERDPPFMGNSHQPGILNQFPDQNHKFNPVQSQSRPGKHEAIPKEKLESDRVHIARRGHPRILLEHPDHSEDVREVDSKIQFAPPLLPHPDGNRTDVNMKDTRDISGERERMLVQSVPDQRNFPGTAGKSHLADSENVHSHPNGTDDGIIRKKLKEDHSVALNQQPVIMKNLALIEKIEGLNNKARNADARNIAEPYSSKEIKEKPKIVGPKADHVTKDVSSSAVITAIAPASGKAAYVSDSSSAAQNPPKVTADGVIVVGPPESQVTEFSKDGKLGESTSCHAYRRGNSPRNSRERPAKDRSANVSGHGWKEQSTIDSLPAVDLKNAQHGQTSVENASQQSHVAVTNEMSDSLDYEAQRTKMRELAVQRAKQLHEEEEERTRQQKAKALAKLEELNRRTSAQGQKKSNDAPQEIDDVHDKQEVGVDATTEPDTSNAESSVDVSAKSLLPPNEPKNMAIPEESKSTPVSHAAGVSKDSVIPNASSSTSNTDTNMMEHVTQKRTSRSHDSSTPKHRQMGYRRRLVVSQEKISSEKSSIAVSTKDVNNVIEATAEPPSADAASHEDSSTQNKKNSRHTRNKKKVDDAPVGSTSPPVVLDASISSTSPSAMLNEQNALKVLREPKIQTPGVVISSSIFPAQGTTVTVGSITFGDLSLASLNQEWQKTHEEAHSTANSCLESVQTKRSGRNQHGVQPVDKSHGNEGVMWASIKQPSKNEQSEETKLYSTAVATLAQPSRKNNDGENVTRARRAEMERYVPKPLSKELQQQNLGQTLPSESQGASVDTSAKSNLDTKSDDKEALDKSTATKAEAAAEHKKWEDKKANRGHGRPNASWRRRNTDESALVVPSPAEHADSSHEVNVVRKPLGQQQALEPNKQSEKHLKSEGNDASENYSALTQTVALPVNTTKEHGATNRQRRHHVKAPRNEGINTINKEKAGRTDVIHQMPALAMDSNLSDHRNMSRSDMKNSGAVSHPKAHWKPKSNSHPQSNAQGNSAVEGHLDSHGDRSDMEKTHGFDSTLQDGRSRNLAWKDGGNGEKETNSEHGKGDMKHEDDNLKSPSHEDTEQQRHNPAPRHHGHHDRRYHRGGGMYRGRGHDAGKPSHGTNKGGTHFEYQPVGSYNKPADFQQNPRVEERTEGHSASGPVYRERSHNRGARPAGHFVRRTVVSVTTADLHRDE